MTDLNKATTDLAYVPPPPESALKNLEDSSSWVNFLLMTYLDPIFAIGNQRPLEMEDLGCVSKNNRADVLVERFKKEYAKQLHLPPAKRSMWHALWMTVGYGRLFLALALFGVSAALQLGPVMILDYLVKYFEGSSSLNKGQLWVLVALLFVFPNVGSICLGHSNAIMANIGAQVRNTLIDVIYRKSLTISTSKKQSISTGRIITMFSDDTTQIRNFLFFLNNSALAPLQIGACLYLIYRQVGVAVFVGLGYSVCVTPMTGVVFAIVFGMRRQKMVKTDMRVKLMNEVLSGIRIIKYYAWENAFIKKITAVRDQEIVLLRKMGYLFNTVFALFLLGAPQIQTVLIFLTYIGLGNTLEASTAFTTLTLFGIMTSPFIFLPFGLQQYSQSLVSMKRIVDYLDAEDIKEYIQRPDAIKCEGENDVVVYFDKADLAWIPEETPEERAAREKAEAEKAAADLKAKKKTNYKKLAGDEAKKDVEAGPALGEEEAGLNRATNTLTNLTMKVRRGELVGIVGTVGSGKSSILTALLGEMHLKAGGLSIENGQSIAYCDQRPWIINATVRDNILFGKEYDEVRFNRAIHVAAMDDDLKILQAGVMTEIGERGINLSGGQKARVCLARAVYNDADIYLLDDPLSAVDAHVGDHIFHRCIKEELSKKTVLLVTHHLHVLPQCDKIVILDDNGSILASGTYEEIMSSGIDVEKYLASKKEEEEEEITKPDESALVAAIAGVAEAGTSTRSRLVSSNGDDGAVKSTRSRTLSNAKKEPGESIRELDKGKLMTKEERNDGQVPPETYWSYITFGGKWAFFLTMFFQLLSQLFNVLGNFRLVDWGKNTSEADYMGGSISKDRSFFWFDGYAGYLIASVICTTFSRTFLTYHRTNASKNFHDRILQRVFFFPVAFFDVTPIGRILNRFSQDMATVDEDLAQTMSQVISMVGSVLGSIGAIAGSTKGTFLILMVPLSFLYSFFNSYFRSSNTAIARLEAISRSPIYADFSQTLSGTTTIRAYGQSARFIGILEKYANNNTVPGVLQQVATQWLSIRLDFLGALVMFFMGALTVASDNSNFIPAGYLALGLSYAIQMTSLLKMAVRVTAQMEAQFNAVERIRHYAFNVDVEIDVPPSGHKKKLLLEDGYTAYVEDEPPVNEAQTMAALAAAAKLLAAEEGKTVEGEVVSEGDVELTTIATPPEDRTPIEPPANWPSEGIVEFDNVQMRYREGALVLKGISFKVNMNDKIGIAGRTGYAKKFSNSLMLLLI